jgi:predicted phosphodiesterase
MRILVISDIHANLPALEAVLSAAGQVDGVWCLGDLVGYGPDPNEVVEKVRSLPNLVCLMGNHDAAALGQIDIEAFNLEARLSMHWLQTELNQASQEFLRRLPEKVVIGEATLAHGSPRNPVWEYILDPRTASANFNYFDTNYCFVGHTHLPALYARADGQPIARLFIPSADTPIELEPRIILNPGSVGQPRDRNPKASFAFFNPEESRWEPQRVEYDFTGVQKRILDAGLPPRHAQRLGEGW